MIIGVYVMYFVTRCALEQFKNYTLIAFYVH